MKNIIGNSSSHCQFSDTFLDTNQSHTKLSSFFNNTKMSIPERWLLCPRFGREVAAGAKFIPMKTMLDSRYDSKIPEEYQWTPTMLVDRFPKMGLIIDLTKTRRYYDTRLLPEQVIHQKIACAGRESTPTQDQVKTFIRVCDMFWSKHPDLQIGVHCTHGFNRTGFMIVAYLCESLNYQTEMAMRAFQVSRSPGIYKDHYITDIFNRYEGSAEDFFPVEIPDWSVPDAEFYFSLRDLAAALRNSDEHNQLIPAQYSVVCKLANTALGAATDDTFFQILRKYGWKALDFRDGKIIEPKSLADEIEQMLHDMKEDATNADDVVDVEGNIEPPTEADAADPPPDQAKKKWQLSNPTHPACETDAAEASGILFPLDKRPSIEPPHLGRLRKICREMVGANEGCAFPGAQPCSLLRSHLEHLRVNPYLVSHKADGMSTYFKIKTFIEDDLKLKLSDAYDFQSSHISLNIKKVGFKEFLFPTSRSSKELLYQTLLDGELVVDGTGAEQRPRFYIFDIIMCAGKDFKKYCYHQRLQTIEKEIIRPREILRQQGILQTHREPFGIRAKRFFPLHTFGTEYWNSYIQKQIFHKTDGLLIVADQHQYIPGSCEALLKWKPPELNSIDFLAKVVHDSEYTEANLLVQFSGGKLAQFTDAGVNNIIVKSEKSREVLRAANGKIVECCWSFDKSRWRIIKVRRDKDHPNSLRTAQNVWQSIRDGLREDELLELARQLRDQMSSKKYAGMNPASQAISRAIEMVEQRVALLNEEGSSYEPKRPKKTPSTINAATTAPDHISSAIKSLAKMSRSFQNELCQAGWNPEHLTDTVLCDNSQLKQLLSALRTFLEQNK